MDFITPQNRQQITFSSLEDKISANNTVRFLEAFAEHLEPEKLSYVVPELKTNSPPHFEAKLFLKIYLYGYLNGIRSSRKLENECIRNIESQWLCGNLVPNYHTIADFRKEYSAALQNTFKLFVLFIKEAELLSSEVVAIDGTKVQPHNSKKNNSSQKKIDRHFAYIEEKTQEYLKQLDENDTN